MAQYSLQFTNSTSGVWELAVYVTLPGASGSLALAWQVLAAPQGGNASLLTWSDTPYACIGTFRASPSPGTFQTIQSLAAGAGQSWSIVSPNNVLQLSGPGPSFTPGMLEIANQTASSVPAAVAFLPAGATIAPAAVMIPSVAGGTTAQFVPQPQFNVVLFSSMQLGQVITNGRSPKPGGGGKVTAGVFAAPQALQFPQNAPHATATVSGTGSVTLAVTYAS
jgi:hypothetical protein